jgi:hypothetical protein
MDKTPTLAELTLAAVETGREVRRYRSRVRGNDARHRELSTAAMRASGAFSRAAGYALSDGSMVIQHLVDPTFTIPAIAAARIAIVDARRGAAAVAEMAEGPLTRAELERLLADFAAEVSMDLDKGLDGYGEGTVRIAERIAKRAGL